MTDIGQQLLQGFITAGTPINLLWALRCPGRVEETPKE